jgi:hypothetical protein
MPEQLELKLESRKTPVDVIIIDHVHHPVAKLAVQRLTGADPNYRLRCIVSLSMR